MPTYTHRCPQCGHIEEHFMSMSQYVHEPPAWFCCGEAMQRFFVLVPGPASGNALASERHYDGLRATDGSDISTRAKHRAYMKAHNLTTIDDYAQTWKRDAQERAERLQGHDPSRAQDVARAMFHVNQSK